jgi:phage tail protein X
MSTWPPTPNQPGPAMGPLPPSPPSPNNNTPLVVGLVLLLVAVVGAAGVFLLSGDDDGDDSENASNRREREEQTEDCAGEGSQPMDGTSDAESQDGCAQPADPQVPAPPTTEGAEEVVVESGPSSSDVLDALASDVYANTPGSIDTDTAFCLAEVIYDVVGESTVIGADADYDDIYAVTSIAEDSQISSGAYSCTTVGQDDDLAASSSWPAAWVPTSDGSGASGGGGSSSSSSSGDVLDALASDVYASTPGSIDTDTAFCLAEVIYSVVGESFVEAAGADYQVIYSSTSVTEDDLISSGAYGCTTVEQDADLAASSSWPVPWTPAP